MTRRVSGEWLVPFVVLVLAGTVGTLIFFFFSEQTLDTAPLSRVTLSDGELLVRPGHRDRGHLFLTRESADGEEQWRTGLFGVQEGTTPLVAGHLVTVRAMRSSGLYETHAFHLSDGSFAWSGGAPAPPLHQTGAPGPTFLSGDVVVEVYEGSPGQLIGLSVVDGKTAFNRTAPIPPGTTVRDGVIRVFTDGPTCYRALTGEALVCP